MSDVHTTHCCVNRHGCKYGEEKTCTVMLGTAPGEYECEECSDDDVEYYEDQYPETD